MHLRNIEGAARTADVTRTAPARTASQTVANTKDTATASSGSRGAFFDMMMSDASAPAATRSETRTSGVKTSSTDQNSTGVRGGSATQPQAAVRNNTPSIATTIQPLEVTPQEPAQPTDPVSVINGLLTKLGYDPSTFNARVTSQNISVPGLSYDYPLLEVTVNGERVGFHLQSAMHDPRITAANISSMMGKPVMNLGSFA